MKRNGRITTPMAEFRAHMRQALHRAHCSTIAEQVLADNIVNFEIKFNERRYNVRLIDVEAIKGSAAGADDAEPPLGAERGQSRVPGVR